MPDLSTRRIAQNNIIAAIRKEANPYIHRRSLDTTTPLPEADRLFSYQAESLKENDLALDLLVQKPRSVIGTTASTLTINQPTISAHVNALSVLNAAAHAQGDLAKQGLKQILPLFEKRPADVGLAMIIIHLYILTNNVGSAINVLDKFLSRLAESKTPSHEDVLYAPGLVALQVSLYSAQNRKTQVQAALAKAASYWWHKSKPPVNLLQAAGASLLHSANPQHQELSRKIFKKLHESDTTSTLAAAGFIASHAQVSPDLIMDQTLSLLPPVEEQIKGIDVTALEEAGIPEFAAGTSVVRKRQLDEKPQPAKTKRNRKSRLPKDYDPSRKPDPERWLPLRERSSYKPPKKKGKKKEAERERTQGGIVNEKPAEKGNEILKAAEKPVGGGAGGSKSKGRKKGRK